MLVVVVVDVVVVVVGLGVVVVVVVSFGMVSLVPGYGWILMTCRCGSSSSRGGGSGVWGAKALFWVINTPTTTPNIKAPTKSIHRTPIRANSLGSEHIVISAVGSKSSSSGRCCAWCNPPCGSLSLLVFLRFVLRVKDLVALSRL